MKKIPLLILIFLVLSCKGVYTGETGNFILKNNSDKVIQFVWLAPQGDFYPPAEEVSVSKPGMYELKNLRSGTYDIAIDFKDEFNSFNSKKDPSKRLVIETGVTRIWIVDETGKIILE